MKMRIQKNIYNIVITNEKSIGTESDVRHLEYQLAEQAQRDQYYQINKKRDKLSRPRSANASSEAIRSLRPDVFPGK